MPQEKRKERKKNRCANQYRLPFSIFSDHHSLCPICFDFTYLWVCALYSKEVCRRHTICLSWLGTSEDPISFWQLKDGGKGPSRESIDLRERMTGRERGGGGCNGNTGERVVGWGREMMQKMRGNEKSEEMEMQMVNKKKHAMIFKQGLGMMWRMHLRGLKPVQSIKSRETKESRK